MESILWFEESPVPENRRDSIHDAHTSARVGGAMRDSSRERETRRTPVEAEH
jgi:hypothetical protein